MSSAVMLRGLHAVSAVFALSLPAFADQPLNVGVTVATFVPDVQLDTLIGEWVARDILTASVSASGRIETVHVEQGDAIAAGAVLATMESVQQDQAVRAAKAGVQVAQAQFRSASDAEARAP